MSIKVEDLQELFDAKRIDRRKNNNIVRFVEERLKLENKMPLFMSLQDYLKYHLLFKKYGLVDKMMKRTELNIYYMCHHKPLEFSQSEFYQQFKNKPLVKKHFDKKRIKNK